MPVGRPIPMRRKLTKLVAILVGLGPIVLIGSVGVAFLHTAPPRTHEWLVLSTLESLPDNGLPVRLPATSPHFDSWTRLPDQLLGAVYARRLPGTREIRVLSAVHGKFGVQVDYDPEKDGFRSQCFAVRFDANGKVLADSLVEESQYEDLRAFPVKVAGGNVLVQWTSQ